MRCPIDYVNLNPIRTGLVKVADGLETYPWTSLAYYSKTPGKRDPRQTVEDGLGSLGLRGTVAGRCAIPLPPRGDGGLAAEGQTLHSALKRGWYFGTGAFREKLLGLAPGLIGKRKAGADYHGSEGRDHMEKQAEAIVRRALEHLRDQWWIVERLSIGTESGLSRFDTGDGGDV